MQLTTELDTHPTWLKPIRVGFGPRYLQVVRMIKDGISNGSLPPGTQIPTQRRLAQLLDIDVSTVSRAYASAHKQGLISGTTGRGTFIAEQETENFGYPGSDLGLNTPPIPKSLHAALKEGLATALQTHNLPQLSTYEPFAIHAAALVQGRARLTPFIPQAVNQPLMLATGTQSALFAILMANCRAGDAVLCDSLTYPGFLSAARNLDLKVIPVKGDVDGMDPVALKQAIETTKAKLLYLNPTLNNPTTRTMSLKRRKAIAACVQQFAIVLVEDDPYRQLQPSPPPPLVTLLPSKVQSYYLASLSKTVWPGLRTSFVLASNVEAGDVVHSALSTLSMGLSPLLVALTVQWLESGIASKLTDYIRQEAQNRQALAKTILPSTAVSDPYGLHIWLQLPSYWSEDMFVHALHERGVAVAAAKSFSALDSTEGAVRISLGVCSNMGKLEQALKTVAHVYTQHPQPALMRTVV